MDAYIHAMHDSLITRHSDSHGQGSAATTLDVLGTLSLTDRCLHTMSVAERYPRNPHKQSLFLWRDILYFQYHQGSTRDRP